MSDLINALKGTAEAQPYPGPWEVHYHDDGTVWVQETVTPERLVVCDIPGDMETIEGEQLANAHLIAAAPRLLAAARAYLALLHHEETCPDCTEAPAGNDCCAEWMRLQAAAEVQAKMGVSKAKGGAR